MARGSLGMASKSRRLGDLTSLIIGSKVYAKGQWSNSIWHVAPINMLGVVVTRRINAQIPRSDMPFKVTSNAMLTILIMDWSLRLAKLGLITS